MKNKNVKRRICGTLEALPNNNILKAWFSNECPLQCIGKKPNGKFEYISLHILEDGFLKTESIMHYRKKISVSAEKLRFCKK